jgi:hypothetical protein
VSEEKLPQEILNRATLRGKEYAWRPVDIPDVIEASRLLGLKSLGGQLQFRLPDGGTCECYWVDVTVETPAMASWSEEVDAAAETALAAFEQLQSDYDFIDEGRKSFSEHLDAFEKAGGNLDDAICFVWYVLDKPNSAIYPSQ